MAKNWDDLVEYNEYLERRVEELEEQVYRLRTSERAARLNSKTPAEQVTINHWMLVDKVPRGVKYRIQTAKDFPEPVADFGTRGRFYDIAELRAWREKSDKALADHRAYKKAMREQRVRDRFQPPAGAAH